MAVKKRRRGGRRPARASQLPKAIDEGRESLDFYLQEISRIPHRGIVYDVSFSPDGTLLATASQRLIQFWDVSELRPLEKEELIEAACSRLTENLSETLWAALFGAGQPYEKLCDNLP